MSEYNFAVSVLWFLAGFCSLTLIFAATSVVIALRLSRRLSRTSDELVRQQMMVQTGVQGIGKRVLELEERLATLRKSQDDLSTSTQDLAYSKARNLIDEGMPDDAIAETSGLTLSEGSLMKLVHNRATLSEPSALSV